MATQVAVATQVIPSADAPRAPEPVLEVVGLTKSYGEVLAVDGVTFEVHAGEIFGLLGPNGAGKTTTVSMLCGLFPPSAGTISVCGHDVVAQARDAKRVLGVVPQDLAVYPTLSARDNLTFFGGVYGLRGRRLRERVDEALEFVGLADHANKRVANFSGGMKRRVNIAAGMLHRPRVLLMDEPTVGVDPQSRNHIFESVRRLNREFAMTVVYSSHYMEEVEVLCRRVAILDGGKLIALDTHDGLVAALGGGLVYLGVSSIGPATIDTLAGLTLVERVEVVDSSDPASPGGPVLKCQTRDAQRALLEIIPAMGRMDIQITSLQISAPNLESVFLHLTGNRLRE